MQNRGAVPVVGVRVVIEGVVQGVGFRPFVWRAATALGLVGRVRNAAGRVEIEATGSPEAIAAFTARLATEAPPRARVGRVHSSPLRADLRAAAFTIDTSASGPADRGDPAPSGVVERLFPPDLATCDACLAEVRDPADRRHRYPFTNCTDCGPRATIIDDLPYDRAATTMHAFAMCPDCAGEYRDPADRRFHAEPVASTSTVPAMLRTRPTRPSSVAVRQTNGRKPTPWTTPSMTTRTPTTGAAPRFCTVGRADDAMASGCHAAAPAVRVQWPLRGCPRAAARGAAGPGDTGPEGVRPGGVAHGRADALRWAP